MSRRDLALIRSFTEAINWLDEFKHTIKDEQALKVIEQFEAKFMTKVNMKC